LQILQLLELRQLQLQLHFNYRLQLQLQLQHYNFNNINPPTLQLQLLQNTTLHPGVVSEVTTATIATTQKAQLQPPFGPPVDSLCHPRITTTHLSYSVLSLKLLPPSAVLLVYVWVYTYIYIYTQYVYVYIYIYIRYYTVIYHYIMVSLDKCAKENAVNRHLSKSVLHGRICCAYKVFPASGLMRCNLQDYAAFHCIMQQIMHVCRGVIVIACHSKLDKAMRCVIFARAANLSNLFINFPYWSMRVIICYNGFHVCTALQVVIIACSGLLWHLSWTSIMQWWLGVLRM